MKKILLFPVAIMLLFVVDSYSQASFSTGAMNVTVGAYGKVLLYTPDGLEHLRRASILVGTTPTSVFDHENDAEVVDATALVATPVSSDFEVYGAYDNSYSNDPPAVLVTENIYGWNNAAYTIVKYNVKNNETSAITASIGLEILPEINQEYGFDTVTYNIAQGTIRFHRGLVENMGIKLLSASLSSLYSFEYYGSYQVDTDFWTWMNMGSLQPEYISPTAEGPVSITSQTPVVIAPGESFNVYYALALGADEATMLANISEATQKYQILTTSVKENQLSKTGFNNSPNPFKSSTTISYQLPENGFVSLKIYDALGNEMASLVNSKQTKGSHTVNFNANNLAGGVYSYRLSFNDQVISNKMVVVK